MLLPVDNAHLLEEVRRRLSTALRPRLVVVFGSRAREGARPESDLDLMVVLDHGGSLGSRSWEVRRHLLDLPVPIDLVVYTVEEHERLRRWRSTVAGIADREGRILVG